LQEHVGDVVFVSVPVAIAKFRGRVKSNAGQRGNSFHRIAGDPHEVIRLHISASWGRDLDLLTQYRQNRNRAGVSDVLQLLSLLTLNRNARIIQNLESLGDRTGHNNGITEKGVAVGIDLQKIEPLPERNVITIQNDIFDENLNTKIVQELNKKFVQTEKIRFDVITSDLAPKTTGVRFMDGGASLDLSLQVLEIAKENLKKGGHCIIKFLPGFNEGDLFAPANELFKTVKKFRPDAIRKSSGERYLICLNKKT
jgi:23S rRNA (uridine2552-2'-O)-methyltransferase